MTPAQLRAARALKDWSQEQLAERSGVSVGTIRALEDGRGNVSPRSLARLRRAFEAAGVELLDGTGVRLRDGGG